MTTKQTGRPCTTCGGAFEWAFDSKLGKWVMLEPIGSDDDLSKSFIDENGVERADHRDRHNGNKATLNVQRLEKKKPPKVTPIRARKAPAAKKTTRTRRAS